MPGWNTSWAFWFLGSVAWKSTIVLGASWLAAALLRRQSAASRHLVWITACAALLALPLLSLALPTLPIDSEYLPSGIVFRASAVAGPKASGAPAAPSPGPRAPARSAPQSPDWRFGLSALWAAGAAIGLAQMLVCGAAVWRTRRTALVLPEPNPDSLLRLLGIDEFVEVLETPSGSMPMTFGLFRPAIFLPADAREWQPERRRNVLLHELAHVKRGDVAAHLLARTALSLYWWNPLMWHAWRESLKERERATDDLVLQAGARPSAYAGDLLEIARGMQASPAAGWAAIAMARRSQLEGRLVAILDSRVNRRSPGRLAGWLAAAIAMSIVMAFAALRAQDNTATVPSDVDAIVRAAVSQKNHEMLESAAKAAEVMRQYDMARTLLDASLAIRGGTSGQQSADYGVGLIKIGDLERSRRNFADAAHFYQKAVDVLGNRPEAVPALVHLGTEAWRNKNLEGAVDYFQRAQVADPAHAGRPLMWMALVRDQQNQAGEADSFFRNALSLENQGSADWAVVADLYASFLSRQNREDEARPLRQQAADARKALGAQALVVSRNANVKPYKMGPGMTAPTLAYKVEPQYSEDARLAKYQGTVVVSVVIGVDGAATNMKVVRGLGLGLDEQAMKAISQWKFKPGTLAGEPVPVMATIEVNFRLL